jgi:glycosyltransferase involved in cell wall biosynthesis
MWGLMRTLSVLIPTYNEERTLMQVLAAVAEAPLPAGWDKEIIIVDDGSTDGTRSLLAHVPHTVIIRERNGGKGAAVKDALRAATGEYCIIQDADLEYDPRDYQTLIRALDAGHPVVFASRLLATHPYFSHIYVLGSRSLTLMFNLFFGTRLTDLTTCYKLFPRALAPAIVRHPADGFVFDAVYLSYELARGGPIREVPISSYRPRSRAEGKKVKALDGVICGLAMLRLKFGQFGKFLVGGGTGLIVNLGLLYLLVRYAHVYYLLAAAGSFALALAANFAIQKLWTFGTEARHMPREAARFAAMQVVVNLGLNTVLLYLLVEQAHVHYVLAQALVSAGLACLTFFVSKRLVFA